MENSNFLNSGRVSVIDPNNFGGTYGGTFDLKSLNTPVSTEDLSIIVELITKTKNRTILDTSNDGNAILNSTGNVISFIDGTSGATTGNQNYLTTQYTEIGTEVDDLGESLGITNIDIDFNSSYAPMVNINFVDVKGSAIFQTGGESKYSVFFKLPYPLFELKIKGFYGKPVRYCLHLIKCNTKFNSQNGNFEISAQFVGYTYAMLSDMLIGYLKGIAHMDELYNLKKIESKNTISINKFISLMTDMDGLVKDQLSEENENTNNLSIIKELKRMVEQMNLGIKDALSTISINYPLEAPITDEYPHIIVVKDPSDGSFQDVKNYMEVIPTFIRNYKEMVNNFNQKSGEDTELKLKTNTQPIETLINIEGLYSNTESYNNYIKEKYKSVRNVDELSVLNSILDRLKGSTKDLSKTSRLIKFYDFTDIANELIEMEKSLGEKDREASKLVAEDLAAKLTSKLGFNPTIRNIFAMLTAHVEVFLELLYDVSSKYKSEIRLKELEKFKERNSKTKSIDVNDETKEKLIYPWPEYIEDGKEKYLGSKTGPLTNPLNVPEIEFVEKLYEAMMSVTKNEQDITTDGIKSWYSINPIDSYFYFSDKENKKPYDRLNTSAKPDDIIRLMMLRGVGFLGFSNLLLTPEEVELFAQSEANLVLSKYESSQTILQAIKNYTLDKFIGISGNINGVNTNVLSEYGEYYNYSYINNTLPSGNIIYNRFILPVDKGFNDVSYSLLDESASEYKITTYGCTQIAENDTANYLDFIELTTYNNKDATSPSANPPSVFSFEELNVNKEFTIENIKSAGFLANNGKYGVQEFNLITYPSDYGLTNDLPFFSLFYGTIIDGNNNWKYPAICGKRKADKTEFDITNERYRVLLFGEDDNDINQIYKNYETAGKNMLSFVNMSTQTQLIYPFLEFGIDRESSTSSSWISTLTQSTLLSSGKKYNKRFGLFTSRFYNAQSIQGRTLLFLHSLPWRGLYGINNGKDIGLIKQPSILNTLRYRTGFVQIPKLWSAFIGGLLWRYETGQIEDPIIFKVGNEYLLPHFNSSTSKPAYDCYLKHGDTKMSMAFNSLAKNDDYIKLEAELINLPDSVKKMFITEFDNFVEEYRTIKNSFEVIPKNINSVLEYDNLSPMERDDNWKIAFNGVNSGDGYNGNPKQTTGTLSHIESYLKNADGLSFTEKYSVFTYWLVREDYSDVFNYNYVTEFKQNSMADNKLKELFFSYKYLSNNTLLTWRDKCNNAPFVKKDILTTYINKFIDVIKTNIEEKEKTKFTNNENESIKLEIYRTLKKIYDKWLADTSGNNSSTISNDILLQCCKGRPNGGRLTTDNEMLKHRNGNNIGLIDTFRFVTRAFKDIGDELQINPTIVSKMLLTSGNNSFYDIIGRILNDNNFEFIALPNFIDYNNPERLKEVFTPYPYYEVQNDESVTGPSFVCVYLGQTSTKLDFGKNPLYPDDGFNFTETNERGVLTEDSTRPIDFYDEVKPHEDRGAAFVVKYGHQNQNIFKDISLDQAEFNETAESINIMDAMANRFSQANQTYVGQNLYNVYSIRSYKAEVEMMGNAMIQPMMYFQLDNIPMFRGAYLITRVRHSIKPNYMSTHFSGTRINRNQTPIIDASTIYSAILNGYDLPKAKANTSITSKSNGLPPIVKTIDENGGNNSNIVQGNITTQPIIIPEGISIVDVEQNNRILLSEAIQPLNAMLTEWVAWMNSNGFKSNNGNYAYIISAYRTIQDQQRVRNKALAAGKPKNSTAEPGTSRHGWGIAIDLQYFDKEGNIISNYVNKKPNVGVGFDINKNPAIKWLYENSYRFGWIIPPELRDNVGTDEFWHWEYHGTAAKCLLEKNPRYRNYNVSVNKPYHPSVINPKGLNGIPAVYTDCELVPSKQSDGLPIAYDGSSSILWTYLLWQQGTKGAREHYKVAKGLMPRYTISVNNIIDNWPSGAISDDGVKASDIRTLYTSNPKKLANAFINVWDKTVPKKSQEALSLIESSKKNRTQKQYLAFKDIFKKYERPNDGIDWVDLATMGFIENSLCTDTDPNALRQGMFKMNKTYPEFSSILQNAKKGPSGYENYVDYDLEKILEGIVPIFVENLKSFLKDTGYTA